MRWKTLLLLLLINTRVSAALLVPLLQQQQHGGCKEATAAAAAAAFINTGSRPFQYSSRSSRNRQRCKQDLPAIQLTAEPSLSSSSSSSSSSSYQADDSLTTREFLEFLQEQECEGLEALEIGFSQMSSSLSQQQQQQPPPLRGIFAKESFQAGDILCAIPFVSTFVVSEEEIILKTSDLASVIEPDKNIPLANDADMGLTFLQSMMMTTTMSSHRKKWQPYLACLPTRYVHFDATPDFWTDDEVEQLEIPYLIELARERRDQIHALAQKVNVDVAALQFATWLVTSRAFTTIKPIPPDVDEDDTIESMQGLRLKSVFIPFLDMINHSSNQPNAEIEVVDTKDDDESFYALRAIRSIEPGEQIWITYGTGQESIDLLARYGFISLDETNPNDATTAALVQRDFAWSTSLEEDELLLTSAVGVKKTILEARILVKRLQHLHQIQQ